MSVTVHGLREVGDKLKSLSEKVQKKYVRKAGRDGMKLILQQAKANAPAKTGLVRKSLRIAGGKGRKGSIVLRIVLGIKNFVGKSYYGAFVEQGHFTGKRPASLKNLKGLDAKAAYHAISILKGRRFVPGKHFMLHAFDSRKEGAVAKFTESLDAQIRGGG
jgi:HK97 gp10 family phage protein